MIEIPLARIARYIIHCIISIVSTRKARIYNFEFDETFPTVSSPLPNVLLRTLPKGAREHPEVQSLCCESEPTPERTDIDIPSRASLRKDMFRRSTIWKGGTQQATPPVRVIIILLLLLLIIIIINILILNNDNNGELRAADEAILELAVVVVGTAVRETPADEVPAMGGKPCAYVACNLVHDLSCPCVSNQHGIPCTINYPWGPGKEQGQA